MRACVITRSVAVARARGRINCNYADIFSWGSSPPEHDGGVSKGEMNRMKARFYNSGQRRCTLCNEYLEASFSTHCGYVGHIARVGILERATAILQKETAEVMTSSAREPASNVAQMVRALLENWWKRLNEVEQETLLDYKRIASLSSPNSTRRLWRVRFLLEFLRDREVIRDCLTLAKGTPSGESCFVRTKRFERSEMIGDNIVKVVVPDRLVRLFPSTEGGVTYKLACIQQLLDSNEGLLQIYDYIDLNSIIGTRLPNNKTKSDVVESLFGELQTFLWASEVACGLNQYPAIPNAEHRYVRALVEHLLNELTHMVIMWRIETTLENAREYLEEQLQLKLQSSQQSALRRAGGGCTVVKEAECDRGRYAVLPLLMAFPYPNASAESRQHRQRPGMPSSVRHVGDKGTPQMLFTTAIPKPELMVLRYRPQLRVVRSSKEYRLEVVKALSTQRNLFTNILPASTSIHLGSRVNARGEKQQSGHLSFPGLAEGKYPTWAREVRIAEVRRRVEEQMARQGVYVEKIDWGNMLAALARKLTELHVIRAPRLQSEPTKAPAKTLSPQTVAAAAAAVPPVEGKLTLVEEMCIPPLKPTME
ncbi:RNA editing complex protein MP67, putative [Trypanosoma cruzi marinkellei]|uniref:RNA editing complex protein MP67, putative n=1 Tax=Trypanosoma cruzi marinkellei TaxID=85056 RepID=K2MZC5_TRYCR|nr:RNA editing complex protein MP67, putative [Trypanosoma cruzi marinkellei]